MVTCGMQVLPLFITYMWLTKLIIIISILYWYTCPTLLQRLMNVRKIFITVLMEQRSVLTLLEALNVNVLQDT